MQTQQVPTVSIGLPVYNREKFITQAIEALLAQTFTDFELIISDNASTDRTEAICRDYAARDARIRYIRQPVNLGLLGNFNYVKQEAKGKYFMWTASDDLCEPQFVEALVSQLEHDPSLALVMADLKYVSVQGEWITTNHLDTIRLADVQQDWVQKRLEFFCYPGNKTWDCFYGLYRTDVAQSCHLPNQIRKNLVFSLEVPFLAQVAVKGKIASIAQPLKIYRYYSESSAASEAKKLKVWDRAIRGAEIWLEMVGAALTSSLSLPTKLSLVTHAVHSSAVYVLQVLKHRRVGVAFPNAST